MLSPVTQPDATPESESRATTRPKCTHRPSVVARDHQGRVRARLLDLVAGRSGAAIDEAPVGQWIKSSGAQQLRKSGLTWSRART